MIRHYAIVYHGTRRKWLIRWLPEGAFADGTGVGQTLFEAESFEGLLREVAILSEALIRSEVMEHSGYLVDEYERLPGVNSVGMNLTIEV